MSRQYRIAVVEDENNILEVISYNLRREGYRVLEARDGVEGIDMIRREKPDLALLDIMLPGMDGIQICQNLKTDVSLRHIPVLMVTARSEESDVVLGLGIGADDYIVKPFSPRELVARVKASLRRLQQASEGDRTVHNAGGLRIDIERHRFYVGDEQIELTPSEFQIMSLLMRSPGRVFTREEILSLTGNSGGIVIERNIDTHVKSIRKKLGEFRDLVETVRGVGYRFRED
ncbi:response regulator transcription factor [bacterium]|nr:response regulator transcription factor [bacterium]